MIEKFTPSSETNADKEALAERQLEELLTDPAHSFLTEIEQNRETIENAETAEAALLFAQERIRERLERTVAFKNITSIEGLEMQQVNPEGLKRIIDTIVKNAQIIGEGGDASVVIDRNEIRNLPPEICYKFAKEPKIIRGRNSVEIEAHMQSLFNDSIKNLPDSRIGVPVPFYSLEIGSNKMIAMEKLQAKSVDQILHHDGFLPEWFDIEVFCTEVKKAIDHLHSENLYHRDMHIGNIMITQKVQLEPEDKLGFIIDFGLSSQEMFEENAYRKETAYGTFTYDDDYGIIHLLRESLRHIKERGV